MFPSGLMKDRTHYYHSRDLGKFGEIAANRGDLDQMTEAVHVAAAIRGGASLVHGVQMRHHVEKVGM